MKQIDRYVLKSFLFSLLVCSISLVGLYVVMDVFQKFDNFLKKDTNLLHLIPMIAKHYLWQVPFNMLPFVPIVTVAAAIFTLTRLSKSNELIPMKASGIQLHRVILPMFIVACVISALIFAAQQWFIPGFASQIQASRVSHKDDEQSSSAALVDESGDTTLVLYCKKYRASDKTMYGVVIDRIAKDSSRQISHAYVDRVVWSRGPQKGKKKWRLYNDPLTRIVKGKEVEIERFEVRFAEREKNRIDGRRPIVNGEALETKLTPAEVALKVRSVSLSFMGGSGLQFKTLGQIKAICDAHPNYRDERIALYQRIVLPLSNLILFLLGVSFVLKQERRSVLVGIGIAITVCLLFYGVNITCQSLGRANNLDPLMATALPLIAFSAVAFFRFDSIPT